MWTEKVMSETRVRFCNNSQNSSVKVSEYYDREPIATKFNHDKICSNLLLEFGIAPSTNNAL